MTPCSWHGEDEDEECPPVEPGERIGEFEVHRLLGKGAFSRVALAQWKGKGREGEQDEYKGERGVVALKLITRESYEGNDRMRISVEREVEVLKVRFVFLFPDVSERWEADTNAHHSGYTTPRSCRSRQRSRPRYTPPSHWTTRQAGSCSTFSPRGTAT